MSEYTQAFKAENPSLRFEIALHDGGPAVVKFSHMSVQVGFQGFECPILQNPLVNAMSEWGTQWSSVGNQHMDAWTKEHGYVAVEYAFDGKSIVCIGADGQSSRRMVIPEDFPEACMGPVLSCEHSCCCWIRALNVFEGMAAFDLSDPPQTLSFSGACSLFCMR